LVREAGVRLRLEEGHAAHRLSRPGDVRPLRLAEEARPLPAFANPRLPALLAPKLAPGVPALGDEAGEVAEGDRDEADPERGEVQLALRVLVGQPHLLGRAARKEAGGHFHLTRSQALSAVALRFGSTPFAKSRC